MVSIIVPNYNHRKFLPKRLDSIFNQSFQDFEIILLDDCSTDDSWEFLKEYGNHPKVSHCIRNEVNSGSPFKQWKKGLDLAKYDWIWIAESDDYSDYDFLNKIVEEFDSNTSLVFSKSIIVDEFDKECLNQKSLSLINKYNLPNGFCVSPGKDFVNNFLVFRNYIVNASSVLFRKPKDFPTKILSMRFVGDWYFWIYLSSRGNIKFISDSINYFRFHQAATRHFGDFRMELIRSQEEMKCFELAFKVCKINFFSKIDYDFYYPYISWYFKNKIKTGRMSLSSIFPDIPTIFYPRYYKLFLLSIFK